MQTNRVIPQRLLVIDPGTATAFAVFDIKDKIATLNEYDDLEAVGETLGHQCNDVEDKLTNILTRVRPDHVLIEDYFFRSKTANGAVLNVAFRACAWKACARANITYSTLSPLEWKAGIAQRSRASKGEKQRWGKLAEKIRIQHALWTNYGLRFANHSLSHKTGKAVKLRYDIIDAVAMGIFYCLKFCKVADIISTVIPREDVNLSGSDAVYLYENSV